MSRNKLSFLIFTLLISRALAEEPSWTLAAEAFSTVRIPEVYAGIETSLPSLLLARMSSVDERAIMPDEQKSRAIASLSAERLKLVMERSSLILERDKAFLSDKGTLAKDKMRSDAEKKITAKERDIKKLDKRIGEALAAPYGGSTNVRVAPWESGTRLFERKAGERLAASLSNGKISGLITGTLEDVSGYLVVTARIETGMEGVPATTVTEAAPYDEMDALVTTIAARLLPVLSQKTPVSIAIKVIPETSVVFLDELQMYDMSAPILVFSGEHSLSVSCDGYRTAMRTYDFTGAAAYDVEITLVKEPVVSVAFATESGTGSLYLHTQPIGETPLDAELPAIRTIGETEDGAIQTFFVFDPDLAADGSSLDARILTNGVSTKTAIESARSRFYWSLGALYLSLPVFMLSRGIARDKYMAYQDGKIPANQANADEINGLLRFSSASGYVSVGLGLNVAFQLFRYIRAAEQAIPKETINTQSDNGA